MGIERHAGDGRLTPFYTCNSATPMTRAGPALGPAIAIAQARVAP